MPEYAVGIDFGTTNTVVAIARADGTVTPITFSHAELIEDIFRSALCFWDDSSARPRRIEVEAGPWAIDQFLNTPYEHRFIQSFKSFAASRLFQSTQIFAKRFQYEDILASFFSLLRRHAGPALERLDGPVIAGRPVRFVGFDPDPALALERMSAAYARAGFPPVDYAYEPVGAAYFFARRLNAYATILVADFGGGTSDFSLMRFTLGADGVTARPLGHSGVGVAGDAFDYRIIDNVVSPRLGKNASYRSLDKILPVPNTYHASFAQWHQLTMLKSPKVMRELADLVRHAVDPGPLEDFITVIENDLGFSLYRSVSDTKVALSGADEAELFFSAEGIEIRETVARRDFEGWIAPELAKIGQALDEVFERSGVGPEAVDQVFMTGGSSFVPAVRRIFEERFAADKLATGDQLQSIASGLALIGLDPDPARWRAPL